jgi:hypothetical protein
LHFAYYILLKRKSEVNNGKILGSLQRHECAGQNRRVFERTHERADCHSMYRDRQMYNRLFGSPDRYIPVEFCVVVISFSSPFVFQYSRNFSKPTKQLLNFKQAIM